MSTTPATHSIVAQDDLILVTGAAGFIGARVVENLIGRGFRNIRCFSRRAGQTSARLSTGGGAAQFFRGNLLSMDDCLAATKDAAVVIHLAAGRGEKSFPDAFMNSVVTTRNLLEACRLHGALRRFINISSFAVYTNTDHPRRRLLDEDCPVETHPERRGEAYCFAKVKQDEIVRDYASRFGIPSVTLRPGVVYGPGNLAISGRVGIGTFGVFLHVGGSNRIPLTYVDNCADAVALAAITPGIDGEVFNIVDDDLPASREFLRQYKAQVRSFHSVYLPKAVSYGLCTLWERYSSWSQGQLPPAFNRSRWNSLWRKTRYTNQKAKARLGWAPQISTQAGLSLYFQACRAGQTHA